MGTVPTPQQPKSDPRSYQLTSHDLDVILFHIAFAGIQGILMSLGTYTYIFGKYSGEVALLIQILLEISRRIVY